MSPRIGMLISRNPTLLGPLSTTLGLRDMYDLIEVVKVDLHNDRIIDRLTKDK